MLKMLLVEEGGTECQGEGGVVGQAKSSRCWLGRGVRSTAHGVDSSARAWPRGGTPGLAGEEKVDAAGGECSVTSNQLLLPLLPLSTECLLSAVELLLLPELLGGAGVLQSRSKRLFLLAGEGCFAGLGGRTEWKEDGAGENSSEVGGRAGEATWTFRRGGGTTCLLIGRGAGLTNEWREGS